MKIFMRLLVLAVVAILALPAWAGVISVNDVTENEIRVYLNSVLVTSNGGGISNWNLPSDNETVTLTYDTGIASLVTGTYYTPIFDTTLDTFSDLFKVTATTGLSTLDVGFYSDGSATFPADYTGWTLLSTITAQGIPYPLAENNFPELVGTYFDNGNFNGSTSNTQFLMASDDCVEAGPCAPVPEPTTTSMFMGAGLLLAGFAVRKARR